uniref:Uncharacterized protein n=1 Tax=Phytophthora ramorum TaxID=164328 RepID=H3GGM4_PHYRM
MHSSTCHSVGSLEGRLVGNEVEGLSYRELPSDWTHEQVVELPDNREAVDESLSRLGLILFHNELKDDMADAIVKHKGGDARSRATTPCAAATCARDPGGIVSTIHTKKLVWRDVDSEGGNVELAVTGVALDYLVSIGEIKELLLCNGMFSRMTPDGKVDCVRLHMEAGAVTVAMTAYYHADHLLRTKLAESDGGGVRCGWQLGPCMELM